MASSAVEWGTSPVSACTVGTLFALAYASLWLLQADLTAQRLPSYKYAFVGFAAVLGLAGWAGHALTGNAAATAAVLAGAAAVLGALVVQHSTGVITVVAAGVAVSLSFTDAFVDGALGGPLGRAAVLFAIGYVASRAEITAMFGPGPTLYALTTGGAMAGTFIFLGGRVDVGVTGGLLLLALLVLTADSRDSGAPPKGKVAMAAVPALTLAAVAWVLNGEAVLVFCVAAAFAAATAMSSFAAMPCPLGPWAHHERRAQTLLVIVVAIVFMDYGLLDSAVPVSQLLAFSTGFAAAAALVAWVALGVEAWTPYNATQHRLYALDLTVVGGMVLVGGAVALSASTDAQAALQWAVGTTSWFNRPAAAAYLQSHSILAIIRPSAVLAGAALCLFVLGARLLQIMHRAVLGAAPLFTHVTNRGCHTYPHVAITFNGAPRSTPELAALLELLEDKGAKGTFFFTGEEAVANVHAIDLLTAAGHEVGVLGLSGAPSLAYAVEDMELAAKVLSRTTGTAPAWFRPADGVRDVALLRAANGAGMAVALWSVYPADWASTPAQVLRRTGQQMRFGGEVVCLHLSEPEHVLPHPGVVSTPMDVVTATSAVFDALSPGISAITMSVLDPHQAMGTEVW